MTFPTYKTILAVAAGVLALTTPALAQDANTSSSANAGNPPAKGAQKGMRGGINPRLQKALNLTPEQQEKIKAIQTAQLAKLKPIRENKSLTPEQQKEQLKPILKDGTKQIMAILTPEQKTKLTELRKQMRQQRLQKPTPQ